MNSTQPAGSTGRCGASTAATSGRIASPRARGENGWARRRLGEPADHALGRIRGGFTTKLHLLTDGTGLPLAVALSAGQAHESQYVVPVLDTVHIRRGTPGLRAGVAPASRATRGYSYPGIRAWLRRLGVSAVIPERSDQGRRRAHRPGRKPRFDRVAYGRRHVIENCVGWLKEARAVPTRFEKLAIHYLGFLKLGIICKLLRRLAPRSPAW